MPKFYRVEQSTNCERVALALAHKGIAVESVWVPYEDRALVRRASGQDLVPVLAHDDGRVVCDSMEIVLDLEDRFPGAPRLYPTEPARRADCLLFIDWFNRVWKRPPNEIEGELRKPVAAQDPARVARLGKAMQGHLDLFEQMLTGRDHLLGEFTAADIAAFPFLKYAAIPDPDSPHRFHRILAEHQRPGTGHPRLLDWIARVDRRPRA